MPPSNYSLIVQPGDSFFPIVEAIDAARSSINITIFRMDDPVIRRALLEAVGRGVRVRALIATSPRGWEKQNKKVFKDFTKAGIETMRPSADSKKRRYHYKILTVDSSVSLVLTFNPTRENLHSPRDYGIVVRDREITEELRRLFEADWVNAPFKPNPSLPLAISPDNSREKLIAFLKSARRTIHISDAKVQDPAILAVLRKKATNGVAVRVVGMSPSLLGKPEAIEYRQITRFKMHAKCTVVDSERAFVGSMNLRAVSLDSRREVGIFVEDKATIAQLEHVFDLDWNAKSSSSSVKTAITSVFDMPPEITLPPDRDGAAGPDAAYALLSRTDALSRYPLYFGENSIGRASHNDIVVAHPSVSRMHAKIVIEDDAPSLVDLASHNGTFLNGEPIEGKATLEPGDIVGIAQSDEFRFIKV